MAPIRRYLRITKYSVLEVRIYLDQPSQQSSWLLREKDPALPRVIEVVRPLVLPKLREENERAKGKKGGKGRGVKDVVSGGKRPNGYDVGIGLGECSIAGACAESDLNAVVTSKMFSARQLKHTFSRISLNVVLG